MRVAACRPESVVVTGNVDSETDELTARALSARGPVPGAPAPLVAGGGWTWGVGGFGSGTAMNVYHREVAVEACYPEGVPMSVLDSDNPPSKAAPITELTLGLLARRELDIPRTRRVYTNRNLKMEDIQLIGFDMDYTLAIYHQAEMERLSIDLTVKKLVERRGYPEAIVHLEYLPEWAIRGVVVDRHHGNVMKMDRHGHAGRVFHGRRELTRAERTELYRRERIRLSAPRYAWIDTLFALPEAVMYVNLVEFLDAQGMKIDYSKLWQDVRECIDEAHRDDSLKSVICGDLARYIYADPDLPATLHKLRSSGKRLFLLTNSFWDYTDAVMRFVLDGKLAAYASWRHYFDVVVVAGSKPAFFTDRNPFVELDPQTGQAIGEPKGALHRGHVYRSGNLHDFEAMAGGGGDRVLYIGDHIYGDILRAKKSSVWRTAMVIQEMEHELGLSEKFASRLRQLDELDRQRRNLDAEVDYQQLLLKSLHATAANGAPNGAQLDSAKRRAKQSLDELRATLREITDRYDRLESELDLAYNSHWGPLFKEGNENSRFGEQVEDYACLYTSRVSNFLSYSPLRYFRAPRVKMPHEI
jgi:HAD superfamily 5'-nucleotidase-like hydrolase